MLEQILDRAADVDVAPAAAMRVLEDARQSDVIDDRLPVERIPQVSQALIVLDAGNVFLVRQGDGPRARHAEARRKRRVEELVVRRPHEWIVDDDRALQHGVLQERAIIRHLVRDAIDDDGVVHELVHRRPAELDVFGDDPLTAAVHFLDEGRRERPLAPDHETNFQHRSSSDD